MNRGGYMLLEEARSFIETMYRELNYNPSIFDKRIKEIEKEIEHTGTYTHTLEELSYGAKLAWRNSNHLYWTLILGFFKCRRCQKR